MENKIQIGDFLRLKYGEIRYIKLMDDGLIGSYDAKDFSESAIIELNSSFASLEEVEDCYLDEFYNARIYRNGDYVDENNR